MLFLMMLTDLTEFGMQGDLSPLRSDPGVKGLWFIVWVASANILIQVSVKSFESIRFRWFIFMCSLIYTLIFIGHQITHMRMGEGFGMHTILDSVHHVVGLWSTIAAYRWAGMKD